MKKILPWKASLILILLLASAGFYILHFLIFHDVHHIFLYMVGDLGFLFLDVLVTILLIEGLLEQRDKQAVLKKLNMIIGTFFTEMGRELLVKLFPMVENTRGLKESLAVRMDWTQRDFEQAVRAVENFSYSLRVDPASLAKLKAFLQDRVEFLLRLLENPLLLEHDRFTDLLWAVFHLAEELSYRKRLTGLPDSDYRHLASDLDRVLKKLVREWILYIRHLQGSYPFLFSLAVRVNPFGPKRSVVVA